MKSCKQLYAEREQVWHNAWNTYNREIVPAMQAEFPVGTKVVFAHGLKRFEGVVEGHGPDYKPDILLLRNPKTGTKWEKPAHEVEKAPSI